MTDIGPDAGKGFKSCPREGASRLAGDHALAVVQVSSHAPVRGHRGKIQGKGVILWFQVMPP